LGVGILIGLTGIGGGSLMTPLLILFAGVQPVVAIGTDLAYGAVTKTLGGWRHLRKGTVDLGVSKWLAVGSVPGSLVGVWASNRYAEGNEDTLLLIIGAVLLVVSISILFRALFLRKAIERELHSVDMTRRARGLAIVIGFVLGGALGLTSVGSGALIGFALILVFRLTPHRVVGTDVFHAAILLWTAGIAHWVSGNVDFGLMGTILIGSLPGVWIGTHLIHHVPAEGLRPALGCVLLGSALGIFTKAGIDLPTWTIVGVPALTGLAFFVVHRSRARASVDRASERTTEVAPA
jgi:uncharacterized membrane protein YfcA